MTTKTLIAFVSLACAGCSVTQQQHDPTLVRSQRPVAVDQSDGVFQGGLGLIRFEENPDGGPRDDTDAFLLRNDLEIGDLVGGGFQTELVVVQDDLFASAARPETNTHSFEAFLHATVAPTIEDVRLPIRFGAMTHYLGQDIEFAGGPGVDRQYFTIGLRLEAEPEAQVFEQRDLVISLFGNAGGTYGRTLVDVSDAAARFAPSDDYRTNLLGWNSEFGVRMRAGGFIGTISYVYRLYDFETSDQNFTVGPGVRRLPGTEFGFHGIMVQGGFTW